MSTGTGVHTHITHEDMVSGAGDLKESHGSVPQSSDADDVVLVLLLNGHTYILPGRETNIRLNIDEWTLGTCPRPDWMKICVVSLRSSAIYRSHEDC